MSAAINALRAERSALRDAYRALQRGAEPQLPRGRLFELMGSIARGVRDIDKALLILRGAGHPPMPDEGDIRELLDYWPDDFDPEIERDFPSVEAA